MIGSGRILASFVLLLAAPAVAAPLPQTVRIVVEQSYEYRPPSVVTYEPIEGVDLPVSDLVEDMLYAAGIVALLADEDGEAEAVVRIVVRGRAIGGSYFEPVRAYLYTGARLAGEIVIEQPGRPAVSAGFLSEIQRPFRIAFNLGFEDPANAPFDTALRLPNGFVRDLADAMARAWGLEAVLPALFEPEPALRYNVAALLGDIGHVGVVPDLIDALDDANDRVRWEAAWSLGRIGDPAAIPDLIVALEDGAEDVRWFASWSLRTISGEDFGTDPEAWSAWYRAQAGGS